MEQLYIPDGVSLATAHKHAVELSTHLGVKVCFYLNNVRLVVDKTTELEQTRQDYKEGKAEKNRAEFTETHAGLKYNTFVRDTGLRKYEVVSRHKEPYATIIEPRYDCVSMVALHEDTKQLVVINQHRDTVDRWVYELPAGKIDPGETIEEAAIREMKEETGLVFTPKFVVQSPCFTSVGIIDETHALVFGSASGELSTDFLHDDEKIKPILIDPHDFSLLQSPNVHMNTGLAYVLATIPFLEGAF